MTYIVGLVGPAKVGKTTTGDELLRLINIKKPKLKVKVTSFARALYQITSMITGVPENILESQEYKGTEWTDETAPLKFLSGWTPRKLINTIGTECFRDKIDKNFWVEIAIASAKKYDIVILTDARFENEYEVCDYTIELSREGIDYARNHPSSMPPPENMIDCKITLYNGVDLSKLANDIVSRACLRKRVKSKRKPCSEL